MWLSPAPGGKINVSPAKQYSGLQCFSNNKISKNKNLKTRFVKGKTVWTGSGPKIPWDNIIEEGGKGTELTLEPSFSHQCLSCLFGILESQNYCEWQGFPLEIYSISL